MQSFQNYQKLDYFLKIDRQIHYKIKHLNVISYIFDYISIDVTKKSLQWTGIKDGVIDRYYHFSFISWWWSLVDTKIYSIPACLCFLLLIASLIKVVCPSNFLYQGFLIFEIRQINYLYQAWLLLREMQLFWHMKNLE